MGAEVNAHSPEPTPQQAQATLHLALQAAQQRQTLADQGFFNSSQRTCNIEQEIQCLSVQTGMPASAEALIASNALPGARYDTVTSIIEYDAGDIATIQSDALSELYTSLSQRSRRIQQTLTNTDPDAIVVPIGVQPLACAHDWQQCSVPQPGMQRRYHLIDRATRRENPHGLISIESRDGGAVFRDVASYMTIMTRCAGTQIHISEHTADDALLAYNISISIAPIMSALFGNSPFVAGIDSGQASTRTALFLQGEPLRAGLPRPAFTLYQYYEQQLARALPPFVVADDPQHALTLLHGALHTASRIQVDMTEGTIRNEFRCFDAQSPFRSMQALLLTLGAIDALKDRPLTGYEEARANLHNAVWGLTAPMQMCGRQTTARALADELVMVALKALERNGLGELGREFLSLLQEHELKHGLTRADTLREQVNGDVKRGRPWNEAVIEAMLAYHNTSL